MGDFPKIIIKCTYACRLYSVRQKSHNMLLFWKLVELKKNVLNTICLGISFLFSGPNIFFKAYSVAKQQLWV